MDNCKINETKFSALTEVQVRQKKGRRRSPTLLKLQWLAERIRKCERIKKEVAAGSYVADSHDIARALINRRSESENE